MLFNTTEQRKYHFPTYNLQTETQELNMIKSCLVALKQENQILKQHLDSNNLIIKNLNNEIKENKSVIHDMREEIINIHLEIQKRQQKDEGRHAFLPYIN